MEQKIGERARVIRIKKGIKQSFVAERLGFKSPSSLNDIEKGRRNLKADKIPILAEALGVKVEELFFDENIRVSSNNKNLA